MIRFYVCFIFSLIVLTAGNSAAFAQGNIDWEERWRLTPPFPPQHAMGWMNDSLSYTRLAYDETRDVVYVVSPRPPGTPPWNGPAIHILDAETGQPRTDLGRSAHFARQGQGGELPVPLDTFLTVNNANLGFGQNWFALYSIDVDDEGRIYACNLVNPIWGICMLLPTGVCDPMYLGQGPFRVWRWNTPTSTPELIYATGNATHTAIGSLTSSEMSYTRWGDALAVSGKRGWYHPPGGGPPVFVDSTRIYVSSNEAITGIGQPGRIAVLVEDRRDTLMRPVRDVTGGGRLLFRLGHLIDVPARAAAHGIAPDVPTVSGDTLKRWIYLRRHGEDLYRVRERQSASIPLPAHSSPVGADVTSLPNTVSLFGPSGAMEMLHLPQWGRSFISAADGPPPPASGVGVPGANTASRFVDVTTWGGMFAVWSATPPVGASPLWSIGFENYISDVDVKLAHDTIANALLVQHFVLMSNNGIASFRSKPPIPVTLLSLHAVPRPAGALVEWTVAAEENIAQYLLDRGVSERGPWVPVGAVAAQGGPGDLRYALEDRGNDTPARAAGHAWYQLTAVEFDGTRISWPPVMVSRDGTPLSFDAALFPQPLSPGAGVAYLRMQSPQADAVTIRLTDLLGRDMQPVRRMSIEGGRTLLPLQTTALRTGVYLMELRVQSGAARILRLLVR